MLIGTPSQEPMMKMNLQLFAEGEPEPTPEPNPAPEPTPEPSDAPTPEPTPNPSIKIKFNHEEREIPYEEAVTHIQKGMNYDKAVERAKQEATDLWIANQGYEWNGKPITTEAEYREAMKEQEIRNTLANRELPEEVINELVESRKFREESKKERESREKQEAQQKDYRAFTDTYPEVKPDEIPVEVWDAVNKGKSLVDAYRGHENKVLRAKIAEFEQKAQVQAANAANASASTGSLTGQGSVPTDFISKETFESNRGNQAWMSKNYDHLVKSMKKW